MAEAEVEVVVVVVVGESSGTVLISNIDVDGIE